MAYFSLNVCFCNANPLSCQVLCENNMQILKLLSEEVFEVKDQMTAAKTKALKERLNEEFSQIFQLCDMVLQQSTRPSLLNVTLQTLQRFLTWVRLASLVSSWIRRARVPFKLRLTADVTLLLKA